MIFKYILQIKSVVKYTSTCSVSVYKIYWFINWLIVVKHQVCCLHDKFTINHLKGIMMAILAGVYKGTWRKEITVDRFAQFDLRTSPQRLFSTTNLLITTSHQRRFSTTNLLISTSHQRRFSTTNLLISTSNQRRFSTTNLLIRTSHQRRFSTINLLISTSHQRRFSTTNLLIRTSHQRRFSTTNLLIRTCKFGGVLLFFCM